MTTNIQHTSGLKSTIFIKKADINFKPSTTAKRVFVSGQAQGRQFEVFGIDLGIKSRPNGPVRAVVCYIGGKHHLMEFPLSKNFSFSSR